MKEYNWNERNIITMGQEKEIALYTDDLHVWYGDNEAIKGVDLEFEKNKITALIGPSGCGKSTYLRSLNRMNDGIANTKVTGKIMYKDVDINAPQIDEIVETSLKQAALWDQVKDSLDKSALALSGGQQQRLCIARAIAMKPDILLLDEPASALDPISTGTVEETLVNLKDDYTIIIVTHNMQQAARISDYTAFFYLGKAIEYDKTNKIFTRPKIKATEDYVSGHFG